MGSCPQCFQHKRIVFITVHIIQPLIGADDVVKLEGKEDMKKRGIKSPDRADAIALACLRQNRIYNEWTENLFTVSDDLGRHHGSAEVARHRNAYGDLCGAHGLGCGDNTKAALITRGIAEITRLREMACGISSPSWEEKVQTSRNTDAPFVRCLEKIMDLEKVVNGEIDTLVDLKRQIRTTVDTVANVNAQRLGQPGWEQGLSGRLGICSPPSGIRKAPRDCSHEAVLDSVFLIIILLHLWLELYGTLGNTFCFHDFGYRIQGTVMQF